jgi:hypothetical protein
MKLTDDVRTVEMSRNKRKLFAEVVYVTFLVFWTSVKNHRTATEKTHRLAERDVHIE